MNVFLPESFIQALLNDFARASEWSLADCVVMIKTNEYFCCSR